VHCAQKFCFHGSFATKSKAVAKERSTASAFIKRALVKGKTRWLVLTGPRKRR